MAINKKLIHFKTKQKFNEELANGNILDTSIVFIKDTKQIYTHGQLYDGSTFDPTDIEASIQNIIDNYATKTEIPTKVSRLENDANYIQDDIISNGVYAVDASGKLIDYTTADSTALGVALVAGEHKFMIAKSDATDGTNNTLYWGKNLYGKDVAGITETTDNSVAKADFGGKANTAAIIAAYGQHSVDMDSRDMCKVLATYAEGGFTDWYVPAAGQLYEIYNKKSDINTALQNIGGTAFESYGYWSSSEHDSNSAWRVNFNYGDVNYYGKNKFSRVRFVRDISVKSLKERVSDLESKIKDLNTSGSSNGAYAEINHGTSDTTFTLTPNTFHVWDEVASLDLSFADETAGIANEFLFQFTSGATATTLTFPDVRWANDSAPTIAENMIYQISVLKGFASVLEFKVNLQLIENLITVTLDGRHIKASSQYPVMSDIAITTNCGSVMIANGDSNGTSRIDMPAQTFEVLQIMPSSDNTYAYIY